MVRLYLACVSLMIVTTRGRFGGVGVLFHAHERALELWQVLARG